MFIIPVSIVFIFLLLAFVYAGAVRDLNETIRRLRFPSSWRDTQTHTQTKQQNVHGVYFLFMFVICFCHLLQLQQHPLKSGHSVRRMTEVQRSLSSLHKICFNSVCIEYGPTPHTSYSPRGKRLTSEHSKRTHSLKHPRSCIMPR